MKTKQVVAFLMAATLAVTSGGVSTLASQNAADAQQKEAAIEESLEGDDAKAGDDAEADAKDDAEAEGEAAEDEVAAEEQQQEDTEESLEGDDTEAKAEAAADEDAAEALQEEAATEESIRVDDAEGDAAVSDNGLRRSKIGDSVPGDGEAYDDVEPLSDEEYIKALDENKLEVIVPDSPVKYGENVSFSVDWNKVDSNVTIVRLDLIQIGADGSMTIVDQKYGKDYQEQWNNKKTTLNWLAKEIGRKQFEVRAIVTFNKDAKTGWYGIKRDVSVGHADTSKFIEDVINKADLGEIEISQGNLEADEKFIKENFKDDDTGESLYGDENYPYDSDSTNDEQEVKDHIKEVGVAELYKRVESLNDELGAYESFGHWGCKVEELKDLPYSSSLKSVNIYFDFDSSVCDKPESSKVIDPQNDPDNEVDSKDNKMVYRLYVNVPVKVVQKAMKVDISAYVDGRVVEKDGFVEKDGKKYDKYNLKLNGHLTLHADVLPKNLADDSVSWARDPESYVSLMDTPSANEEIVKANKKGRTTVTATAKDGGGAKANVVIDSESGLATSDIDFSFFPKTKEYEGDAPITDYLLDELHDANLAAEGVGQYEITQKTKKSVRGDEVADDNTSKEDGSGYVYEYDVKFTLDNPKDAVDDANSKPWDKTGARPSYTESMKLRVTPAIITRERVLEDVVNEDYSEQGTTLTVPFGTKLNDIVNQSAKGKYKLSWYEENGTTPVKDPGIALSFGTSIYVLKYDEGEGTTKDESGIDKEWHGWEKGSPYAGYTLAEGDHTLTFTITVEDLELKVYADTSYPHPDKYKNGAEIDLFAFQDPERKTPFGLTLSDIYNITVTWIKDGKAIRNGDIVKDKNDKVYYYKDAYWLQNNQGSTSGIEPGTYEFPFIEDIPDGKEERDVASETFKGLSYDHNGDSIDPDQKGYTCLPLKVTSESEGTYTAVVEANINAAGRNSEWFSSLNPEMQQKYARLTATDIKEVRVTDILFGEDAVTIFDPDDKAQEVQIKEAAKIHIYDENGKNKLDDGKSVTLTYGDTASKKLNVRVKAKDIVSYEVCYTDEKGEEHRVGDPFNVTDEASQILFADGSLIGEGYKGVSIGNLDAGTYDFYVRVKTKSDTTGVRSGKIRVVVKPKTISDAFFDKSLIKVESITYGQNYNTAKVSCADAAIDSEVQFKVKEDQIAKKTGPVTVTVCVANMNDIKNYDLSGKWQFRTVLDVVAYPVTVTALDKTCEAGPIPTFTDADWTANIPEEILAINGDTVASVLDVKLTVQKDGAQTAFVTAGTYDIVPNATPKNNNFSVGETKWGTLTVTGGAGGDIETNGIQFNKKQIVFTNIGKTREFAAAVVPATESNAGLTFESDNESVATVEVTDAENGKAVVTAVANGEANIVVTAPNGVSKSLHVTVKQEPKKVVISRSGKTVSGTISVSVGKKYDFDAKVQPSTVYKKGVTWSTSNAKVATVGKKGKVTVKAAGTVKITATAKGGAKSKTITLKAK